MTTYEGNKVRELYNIAMNVLEIADRYNGICYGGFVRDILSRCINEVIVLPDSVIVGDIDIWFKSEKDRDGFVMELPKNNFTISNCSDVGDGVTYSLTSLNCECVVSLDLVVSESFPAFDSVVNYLVYDYKTRRIGFGGICISFEPTTISLPLALISEKKMPLTAEAYKVLGTPSRDSDRLRERLISFSERGWNIVHNSKPYDPKRVVYNGIYVERNTPSITSPPLVVNETDSKTVLNTPSPVVEDKVCKYVLSLVNGDGTISTITLARGTKIDLSDLGTDISLRVSNA